MGVGTAKRARRCVLVILVGCMAVLVGLITLRLVQGGYVVIRNAADGDDPMAFTRTYECSVWNLWLTPLAVDVPRTSCSCVGARISPQVVPFGRKARVTARVWGLGRPPSFQETLVLRLSRGRSQWELPWTVSGRGSPKPSFTPDAVVLPADPGEPFSAKVVLTLPKSWIGRAKVRPSSDSALSVRIVGEEPESSGRLARYQLEVIAKPVAREEFEESVALLLDDRIAETLRVYRQR